ncbi:MAG: hypothetical protein FD165_1137 [Gammaproteobacteria bacterium]|nr:MAG: hypothetical protein FD165_1137 [Gammaproteobacteria bacterium]TND07296.1 MAG: hypothetical protein FD120_34 [Gammaproteobacteria bacterium]
MAALLRRLHAALWIAFFTVLATAGFAAESATEILELKNRPASEIIPMIKPFLANEDAISGTGFRLIIRTTPANMKEIRKIVASIDQAPRRLVISVRQSDVRDAEHQAGSVSGSISTGGDTDATIGGGEDARPGNGRGVTVRVTRTRSQADEAGTQQIQVLEGHSASIRVGQSVPVVTRAGNLEGKVAGKHAEFTYRDVTAGFDVLPRTNGNQVTLEIRPHRASMDSGTSGAVTVRQMHTTISGRLGEWLEVGGISQTEAHDTQGYVFSTKRSDAMQGVTLIKVDELPE